MEAVAAPGSVQFTPQQRAIIDALIEEKQPLFTLLGGLFPLQRDIINDNSRRKLLLAGRRGGKSHLLAAHLLLTLLKPSTTSLFLGLTRLRAKELCWNVLKELSIGLPVTFNEMELIAVHRNGSRILLGGCDNRREAEKYRGSKLDLVCIDEAAFFDTFLDYLVEEVLSPALFDKQGTLILSSSPNRTSTGYFFSASNDTNWKKWHFTVRDNPKLDIWDGDPEWQSLADSYLEQERKVKGWEIDTPAYQREWEGRWVRDTETLVLDFSSDGASDPSLFTPTQSPQSVPYKADWKFVIGVDFGVIDPNAIVVGAFNRKDTCFYLVDTFQQAGMSGPDLQAKIREFNALYHPIDIVGDPAPGKQTIVDLAEIYRLPIRSADKHNKAAAISLFADEFKRRNIRINRNLTGLIDDWKLLTWLDREACHLEGTMHQFDAALYAWRASPHFYSKPETPLSKSDKDEERIYRQVRRQNRMRPGRTRI